jgi:N-acetylmuramoyl-L-alanine amidase
MKNSARLAGLALVFLCFAFITVPVKKTIVIDAGHGGDDHGVTHDELSEKLLVQTIAAKIKALDITNEIEVILLREDDSNMPLVERVEKINQLKPDLLISLHVNYSQDRTENGVSAYVSQSNHFYTSSAEKAETLVNNLANNTLAKKEVKNANIFILKNAQCPALLLQLGYMTNEGDRKYISSERGQNEVAGKIMEFLKK